MPTKQRKITFELYYKESITPTEELHQSLKMLDDIRKKKSIEFQVFTELSENDEENLKDEIRIAATKLKFKVVTKGGGALVISGSKKLNYQHGPILVVRSNQKIIEVFPRGDPGSKESRWTAIDFLSNYLRGDLAITDVLVGQKFLEEDLRNLIISTPGIIELGLIYHDVEVEIESSRIDLVLIDKKGNHLLLEFKLNATDQTIGQVTRYNLEYYSQKFSISKEKLRRGIVTLSVTGQIKEACKTQQIELYVIRSTNYGFKAK